MDAFPEMNFNIEITENEDMVSAQTIIVESIKAAAEESGQPLTIDQWELLKVGQQNATIIFCNLVDEKIAQLKEDTN